MFVARKLWKLLLLALVFCTVQMLSGCFVWDIIWEPKDPEWVTIEKGAFQGDEKAEFADWFEDGDPKISSGLVLRIGIIASGVPIVEEIQREVNMNGEILMTLIGGIKCVGLTIFELQKVLEEQYAKYYHDPQATVSFAYAPGSGLKSPWGSVLVMGAVGKEGPVDMPSTRDLTVIRVLMLAGGVSPIGDKTKVRVARRTKEGDLLRYRVNVKRIGEKGRYDLDLKLRPGDVVWVPETWY